MKTGASLTPARVTFVFMKTSASPPPVGVYGFFFGEGFMFRESRREYFQ
jgi:hypothetical protein